jgi:hypothetical protein
MSSLATYSRCLFFAIVNNAHKSNDLLEPAHLASPSHPLHLILISYLQPSSWNPAEAFSTGADESLCYEYC